MRFLNLSVDVEANGPCPANYSMVSVGIVSLDKTHEFYAEFCPIAVGFQQGAYDAIGLTWAEHNAMPLAELSTMQMFRWLKALPADRLVFWSDNPAFDWQFVNYYLWRYVGENPFGFSARRIGDLYAGSQHDVAAHTKWKSLRRTKHTHNALDDAKGNAEALDTILKQLKRGDHDSKAHQGSGRTGA